MMSRFLPLFLLPLPLLAAGPYPPAVGKAGTDAMAKDDPAFIAWARGWSALTYGADVDATWKTPAKALGPATSDPYDIVSLGNKGNMTLWFPHPIADGPGADFAVFENSFSDTFLELAWVEVSSDGTNFFRFPNRSLTASTVGAFGMVDPTNVTGLAGKYRGGYGTPFDLGDLPESPLLDRSRVAFVRLVDIAGDGSEKDDSGHVIYDPYPTTGSAGFDLDAIGVIHQNEDPGPLNLAAADGGGWLLTWSSNPGDGQYRLETSSDLVNWQEITTVPAEAQAGVLSRTVAGDGSATARFWRIVRVTE